VASTLVSLATNKPHVALEWIALLLDNREVPVTNLGPDTTYLTEHFPDFPQSFQSIAGQHRN
jgi:hypothetical protein